MALLTQKDYRDCLRQFIKDNSELNRLLKFQEEKHFKKFKKA